MKKALLTLLFLTVLISGCSPSGPQPVAITLAPATAQAVDDGQSLAITATASNDPSGKGVTWSLNGPGSLANPTTTAVTYNAPASGAAATAAVTATSVADATKTASLTINVTPPPAITTTTLPAGTEGTAYNQTVAATGGAGTLSLLVIGNLPAGLTMSTAGVISGTPAGPNGTSNFTVKATDSSTAGPQSATQALSIVINLPPPPSITTTSLPAGVEGTAYNQTITATGGLPPYAFSISSATGLPAGLAMDTSGHITGVPGGPNGTSNFTVKVTDKSNPAQSASQNLSITINLPPPPVITTTSLPPGVEGTAYNQSVAASGGLTPYTFSISNGALPAGLTLNANTGAITGTPRGPNGTSNFTVTVTDKSNPPQTGSQNLSISINLPPPPVISPTSLPNGNVGTPYNQVLTVSGGLGPTFTWLVSSGTLPAGLTLTGNNATATISGTPTTAQNNVAFTIQVTDSSVPPQSGSQNYTVTINPPTPLTITTNSPLPQGAFNTPYNTTITAAGGIAPYTFSLDASSNPLPAGLTLTNSNNQGVISGTPTTAGTFTIIVDVHDSQLPTNATAQKTFTLVITAPAIVTTPSSLPSGTQGTAYTANISASGGVPPYTFTLDASSSPLPAGLSFSATSSQATISGTPTATGTTNNIIVDVKDSETPPVTQKTTYSITINSSTPPCGTGSEAKLNGQYAFLLQGFDANGPVAIAGSFTANGAATNNITAGQEDVNRNIVGGVTNPQITPAGSSYSVGSDNRGCLTLVTGTTTSSYRFSLGAFAGTPSVATKGHIVSFDATGTNVVGVFEKQDPGAFSTAGFSGDFAFGASAPTLKGTPPVAGRFAVAGRFTADGVSAITAAEADVDDNGTPTHIASFTGPNSYTLAANGRGTLTLNPAPGLTVHASFYVVSANEGLLVSTDPQTTGTGGGNSLFAGSALKQSGGPPFLISSLSAPAILSVEGLTMSGTPPAPGSDVTVGILSPTGAGTFTFTFDENNAGTITTPATNSISGNYLVAGNGRVTISGPGVGPNPPVIYLVSQNKGFLVGSDNGVIAGFFEPQVGTNFTNASVSGNYFFGDVSPVVSTGTLSTGVATANGGVPGSISGTSDDNGSGTLTGGQTFSDTYTVSLNGRTTTGGGDNVLYIVSSTKAVLMSTKAGKNNSTLTLVEK